MSAAEAKIVAVSDACACGSGLAATRCCAFDDAYQASPGDLQRALGLASAAERARATGRIDEAETFALRALAIAPRLAPTRALLGAIRHAQGRIDAAIALYRRAIEHDPNLPAATADLGLILFRKGDIDGAEPLARMAVRLTPEDPQAHNLLAMVLTERQLPQAGEHHYRRVLELIGRPDPIVLANLGWNLKNQGRIEEARACYRQSVEMKPDEVQTLLGWAKMEEADRNFDEAMRLLAAAEAIAPGHPLLRLFKAVTEGRNRNYEAAIAILDSLADETGALGPGELVEKGLLLDRMGRYDDAFAAFDAGKRMLRERSGMTYADDAAASLIDRLRGFFTAERVALLPRAPRRGDIAQPLFIVGFPRSGTTMVEQTLTAHPAVSAGDELPMMSELSWQIPQMLGSPLAYPEALSELWLGDRRHGLEVLRDFYFHGARQRGVIQPGKAWFTDKMPLNETHLGLIHLLFPDSPVLHLLRHPLDVVLSVYSNLLTHGFCCAYALDTAARHYLRVADLIAHYRAQLGLRYLPVRYEDVVADQEAQVRRMLAFVGLLFDPRCLSFHENRRYARTASYAQVTEKLYDRSRYRYRHYLKHLEPVVPMLEPVIARLGYTVDRDD
jgi:tetratricopeptide (TPR) repeat protein